MTGPLLAAAAGVGFGAFQTLNRRAVGGMQDAYLATFLQLLVAMLVLLAASAATEGLDPLRDAPAAALLWFAGAGLVHFFVGWTFLNMSQMRIGASRTSPLLVTLQRVEETGWGVGWKAAVPGLAAAFAWSISPIFIKQGLEDMDSPLLGLTLGMAVALVAYAVALPLRPQVEGAVLGSLDALAFKLAAGIMVGLSVWARWESLDSAGIAVVLALGLLSVPVVLFASPLLMGRHLEKVTLPVWAGAGLVVGGALLLIAVA